MDTQGGESAAEMGIATALRLICQMQEQQMQVHTQHMRVILDMATHQAEDRANMHKLLKRTAGSMVSSKGFAGVLMPAAKADRLLTIFLQKMEPFDDGKAFLEIFKGTAEACGWSPAQWGVHLLPLLTEQGLSPAHGLPAASYLELRQAGSVSPKRATDNASGRSNGWTAPDHFRHGPMPWWPPSGSRVAVGLPVTFPKPLPASSHQPTWLVGYQYDPASASVPGPPQGAPQMPGLECGCCGRLTHNQHECPVMEVGQVVEVATVSPLPVWMEGTT